jgi:hypothetical protein
MTVNTYLEDLSSKLIITKAERTIIDDHVAALKNKAISYFKAGEIEEQFPFGSFTRKTLMPRRADPESDADYMVVFRDNSFQPATYLSWIRSFANERYQQSEIYPSHPAIVLELSRIKIEIVPAIKNYFDSYQIPAPTSQYSNWLTTHPNSFNVNLTNKNTNEKSLIGPLIRLLKYWNAKNGYVYSSFELEQLVVDHWFYSCSSLKDYLYSFVDRLPTFHSTINRSEKVRKLKDVCVRAKQNEENGLYDFAIWAISSVFPEI